VEATASAASGVPIDCRPRMQVSIVASAVQRVPSTCAITQPHGSVPVTEALTGGGFRRGRGAAEDGKRPASGPRHRTPQASAQSTCNPAAWRTARRADAPPAAARRDVVGGTRRPRWAACSSGSPGRSGLGRHPMERLTTAAALLTAPRIQPQSSSRARPRPARRRECRWRRLPAPTLVRAAAKRRTGSGSSSSSSSSSSMRPRRCAAVTTRSSTLPSARAHRSRGASPASRAAISALFPAPSARTMAGLAAAPA
jgi:hypothetical protein